MKRRIEQWTNCNPETMAHEQSDNAKQFAFEDAKADILELAAENVRLHSACDNLRYTAKQALDALYFHTAHTRPIDSTFSAIAALNTALKEQAK